MKLTDLGKLTVFCAAMGLASQVNAAAWKPGDTLVPGLPCAVTEVTQNSVNANGCAGSYEGNINASDGPSALNSLASTDWTGTAPNPLDGWLFGAEDVDGDTSSALPGVKITYGEKAGEWEVTIGTYDQFVLGLKQGNYFAFYYFSSLTSGDGTYLITWFPGGNNAPTTDLSHMAVYVRNGDDPQVPVPEPGTLALMGFGLVGLGMVRRRRKS